MKKILVKSTILFIILLIISCENNTLGSIDDDSPSYIYFGGSKDNKSTIWKVDKNDITDIEEISLSDGTIIDIELVGDDVYSLVFNGSSPQRVSCYKNSQLMKTLSDTNITSKSFVVKNEKVYIFGYDTDKMYLWVIDGDLNVVKHEVASGEYTVASELYIEDDVVYLTGYYSEPSAYPVRRSFVFFGDLNDLASGFSSTPLPTSDTYAKSCGLHKEGNFLYIYGTQFSSTTSKLIATYWKMNILTKTISETVNLAETPTYYSEIQDLLISGNNAYATSIESTVNGTAYYQLKYWKNGIASNLNIGDNFCSISDVYVDDENIYTGGNETVDKLTVGTTNVARFWVNQVAYDLTDTTHNANISCLEGE